MRRIVQREKAGGFVRLFQALEDVVLPSFCLLCGAPSGRAPICAACAADLPPLPEPRCPICQEATPDGMPCGACQKHPPHFDRSIALHSYAFPLDRLILELKYHARFGLARAWGQELAARLAAEECHETGRIIPLPLHAQRLAERGYNQALEIARHLARATGMRLDAESLVKHRATQPQSASDLKMRHKNIRNAFTCRNDLQGARVWLVDDVLTTGATLNEAARTLKLHGAREVLAVTVARTPKW
jgi:ComF family protein